MGVEFGIVLPLWSYGADRGQLLDRAAGEVGLDHVTVPVVTGAQTRFRLGVARDEPHFHTEGGWHFPPTAKAYAPAGLRPPKARWFAAADVLGRVREQASRLGIRLVLRIDLRGVRALVERQTHLCQRNAWGQEMPSAGACTCNPDLRGLLRATIEDLRRYEPAGYELVNWVPDGAVDRATARPLAWHAGVRKLLDICFCSSCRQVAERESVDPDHAARSLRVQVERCATWPEHDNNEDPVVAAYVAARVRDCGQWLSRIAEADSDRRYHLVQGLGNRPSYTDDSSLMRLVGLPADVPGAVDAERTAELLQDVGEGGGLALPVWRPTFNEPAALVRLVSEAARGGVRMFDFEGLDEAPREALTWLKQAVRFARRR